MKLLVVGATGKTGQKILSQLEKTDHIVFGLIRSKEQKPKITKFGATPLIGDLTSRFIDLNNDIEAILFVAGSGGKDLENVDHQGFLKILKAAEAARVTRFLYISSINTGKPPAQFIEELEAFYRSENTPVPEKLLSNTKDERYRAYVKVKEIAEQALIHSTINYTILRAGLLTEEPGSGTIRIEEGSLNAFGKVSRENVATCFVKALEDKKTFRKIYTILDGETPIESSFG